MVRLLALAALVLVSPLGAQTRAGIVPGGFTVRTVLPANGGAYTQAIVIETAGSIVVIDGGSSQPHAERIVAVARASGKPIVALFLTHGHVDHYGGAGLIRDTDTPMITGAGVARQIAEYDSLNFARFGARPPAGNRQPDRILGYGDTFRVDGVTLTLFEAGPGESYADVWYLVTGTSQRAAVIGDLVMYGIPPFAQSGHTGDWLRSLERLRAEIPAGTPIYVGHDRQSATVGDNSWTPAVIDLQVRRLQAFREAVREWTAGERLLTEAEIAATTTRLMQAAPEYDPKFAFLISSSANVLAAELILERQREMFEGRLRAALSPPSRE